MRTENSELLKRTIEKLSGQVAQKSIDLALAHAQISVLQEQLNQQVEQEKPEKTSLAKKK